MDIPLLMGRNLSDTDTLDHPAVAIVNEQFVKHYCGGSNASCIGRHIGYGIRNPVKVSIEVVGIFRDYHTRGIRDPIPAIMIRPLKQSPETSQLYIYLRTRARTRAGHRRRPQRHAPHRPPASPSAPSSPWISRSTPTSRTIA